MQPQTRCPECGTPWADGVTCQDHFHQMLFWEHEFPTLGEVHHLMVLSYYLQHPSLYAPDGLREGVRLLQTFLVGGQSTQTVRVQNRERLDSGRRTFKIKATATAHGEYAHPVAWTMTAADVVASGAENYCAQVRAWAGSILAALQASHNLPA